MKTPEQRPQAFFSIHAHARRSGAGIGNLQAPPVTSRWEEISEDRSILQAWERKPMTLHCVFRFEMEHLLARTGFQDRVVYGNFFKNPLSETSSEMIWGARKA
jgi:hypothetical protein